MDDGLILEIVLHILVLPLAKLRQEQEDHLHFIFHFFYYRERLYKNIREVPLFDLILFGDKWITALLTHLDVP
jgi:hypothetical protein